MNKTLLFLVLMLLFPCFMQAQEFNCRVSVNADNMAGEYASQVNKDIFKTLEQGIAGFINERKWTEYAFTTQEKIECNIQLIIEQAVSAEQFTGKLYVQMSRPVFNSTYTSSIFAFQDNDLSFKYTSSQTFEYDESSYLWTITSLTAFYANLMLGIIFDTFGNQGGTPFYVKCMNIASSAPAGEAGWSNSSKDSRNRYWLLDSYYNNPSSSAFRTFLYQYHRMGLDVMSQDLQTGYQVVLSSLQSLQEIARKGTNMYCMNILGMYKSGEWVNMFAAASDEQKQRAVELLNAIDPSNSSKYEKIQK